MSLIYKPSGRAKEYAPYALNIYSGCDHGCIYCYAPACLRRTRESFYQPSTRKNFVKKLTREAAKLTVSEKILLCFTCDPYQSLDVEQELTRQTIQILKSNNLHFQVLTKGGSRALRDLELFTPQDAFGSTLTLLSEEHTTKWEPGAASTQDRIETIKQFHAAGVTTWVSLEPVLNPESALEIIRQTHKFVDLFKVGKLNYHKLAKQIDWHKFAIDVKELLISLDCNYYIKKDLLAFVAQ